MDLQNKDDQSKSSVTDASAHHTVTCVTYKVACISCFKFQVWLPENTCDVIDQINTQFDITSILKGPRCFSCKKELDIFEGTVNSRRLNGTFADSVSWFAEYSRDSEPDPSPGSEKTLFIDRVEEGLPAGVGSNKCPMDSSQLLSSGGLEHNSRSSSSEAAVIDSIKDFDEDDHFSGREKELSTDVGEVKLLDGVSPKIWAVESSFWLGTGDLERSKRTGSTEPLVLIVKDSDDNDQELGDVAENRLPDGVSSKIWPAESLPRLSAEESKQNRGETSSTEPLVIDKNHSDDDAQDFGSKQDLIIDLPDGLIPKLCPVESRVMEENCGTSSTVDFNASEDNQFLGYLVQNRLPNCSTDRGTSSKETLCNDIKDSEDVDSELEKELVIDLRRNQWQDESSNHGISSAEELGIYLTEERLPSNLTPNNQGWPMESRKLKFNRGTRTTDVTDKDFKDSEDDQVYRFGKEVFSYLGESLLPDCVRSKKWPVDSTNRGTSSTEALCIDLNDSENDEHDSESEKDLVIDLGEKQCQDEYLNHGLSSAEELDTDLTEERTSNNWKPNNQRWRKKYNDYSNNPENNRLPDGLVPTSCLARSSNGETSSTEAHTVDFKEALLRNSLSTSSQRWRPNYYEGPRNLEANRLTNGVSPNRWPVEFPNRETSSTEALRPSLKETSPMNNVAPTNTKWRSKCYDDSNDLEDSWLLNRICSKTCATETSNRETNFRESLGANLKENRPPKSMTPKNKRWRPTFYEDPNQKEMYDSGEVLVLDVKENQTPRGQVPGIRGCFQFNLPTPNQSLLGLNISNSHFQKRRSKKVKMLQEVDDRNKMPLPKQLRTGLHKQRRTPFEDAPVEDATENRPPKSLKPTNQKRLTTTHKRYRPIRPKPALNEIQIGKNLSSGSKTGPDSSRHSNPMEPPNASSIFWDNIHVMSPPIFNPLSVSSPTLVYPLTSLAVPSAPDNCDNAPLDLSRAGSSMKNVANSRTQSIEVGTSCQTHAQNGWRHYVSKYVRSNVGNCSQNDYESLRRHISKL